MLAALLLCAAAAGTVCGELSVTTYNGGKTAEVGELIFEDNFDFLDLYKWQHELTLWGGGVSRGRGCTAMVKGAGSLKGTGRVAPGPSN